VAQKVLIPQDRLYAMQKRGQQQLASNQEGEFAGLAMLGHMVR
jgi:hypothetical protein